MHFPFLSLSVINVLALAGAAGLGVFYGLGLELHWRWALVYRAARRKLLAKIERLEGELVISAESSQAHLEALERLWRRKLAESDEHGGQAWSAVAAAHRRLAELEGENAVLRQRLLEAQVDWPASVRERLSAATAPPARALALVVSNG